MPEPLRDVLSLLKKKKKKYYNIMSPKISVSLLQLVKVTLVLRKGILFHFILEPEITNLLSEASENHHRNMVVETCLASLKPSSPSSSISRFSFS